MATQPINTRSAGSSLNTEGTGAPVIESTNEQPQTVEAQAEQVSEEPRIIAGLQEGRIVDYRLKNSIVRPAIVVCAGDRTGLVALVVFFKGIADRMNFNRPLTIGSSGHEPDNSVLVLDVPFSETYSPDTWGWPAKQAVRAASVDAGGIEPVVLALIEPIVARVRQQVLDDVDAKFTLLEEKQEQLAAQSLVKLDESIATITGKSPGECRSAPVHNHPPDAPCAAESCPAFDAPPQAAGEAKAASSTEGQSGT